MGGREIRKLEKKILLRHSPPAAGKLAIDFQQTPPQLNYSNFYYVNN